MFSIHYGILYIYIYTYIYIYIYIHIYIYTYIYIYINIYIYIDMLYIYRYVIYICMYICTCWCYLIIGNMMKHWDFGLIPSPPPPIKPRRGLRFTAWSSTFAAWSLEVSGAKKREETWFETGKVSKIMVSSDSGIWRMSSIPQLLI